VQLTLSKDKTNIADLFDPRGRYGAVSPVAMTALVVGAAVGWGFVVNSYASWLAWQGYFMGAIGGKDGNWAYANLGVLFALAIGFLATFFLQRGRVKKQEAMA